MIGSNNENELRQNGPRENRVPEDRNREVVLGLNAYSHDASAVLFVDGELVFAAEEERYVRVKHVETFPRLAIEAALRHAGVQAAEVARVAFCWRRDMAARSRFI